MDTNTIMLMGNFIAIVAMFITMVVLIQSQNKKFDAIQKDINEIRKELYDFKVVTNDRLTRIESKLELQSKDYVYTNKRVDDTIESVKATNTRLDRVEDYNKNIITQVLDKINIQTGQPVIN